MYVGYDIHWDTGFTGVAYKSKYELCNLKAECTNLAKEFTTAVFLDVNRWINLSLVGRYMKIGWNL